MADIRKTLLDLLACANGDPPADIDWFAVLTLANRTLVTPILAGSLRGVAGVPAEASQLLETVETQAIARNRMMRTQLEQALAALNDAGVQPILLKGTGDFGLDYAGELTRITSDLDLLVDRGDLEQAENALHALGYHKDQDDGRLWGAVSLANPDFPGMIDLHWRFKVERPRLDYSLLAESAAAVTIGTSRALVPAPTHRAAILILHDQVQESDYVRGSIDLRHMFDLDALVRSGGVDWDRLLALAPTGFVRRAITTQLHSLAQLLGTPVPPKYCRGRWSALQHRRRMAQLHHPWIAKPLTMINLALDRESSGKSDLDSVTDRGPTSKRIRARIRGVMEKSELDTKV